MICLELIGFEENQAYRYRRRVQNQAENKPHPEMDEEKAAPPGAAFYLLLPQEAPRQNSKN